MLTMQPVTGIIGFVENGGGDAMAATGSVGKTVAVSIVAAAIAAAACSAVSAKAFPFIVPPPQAFSVERRGAGELTPEERAEIAKRDHADQLNAAILLSLTGGALGVALGLGIGSSFGRIAVGMAGGLILGALAGAAGALVGHFARPKLDVQFSMMGEDSMTAALLLHGGMLAIAGLGIGLGSTLACGRLDKHFLGGIAGLAGGAIGGVAYVLLVGVVDPISPVMQTVPATPIGRATWIGCLSLFVTLAVALSTRGIGAPSADTSGDAASAVS